MNTLMSVRGITKALVLLVIGASLLSASTISYSVNIFMPPGTEMNAPWTQTVQLPRFDTSGAPPGQTYVLDFAVLTLNWTSTGSVDVQNTDVNSSHAFTNATSAIPLSVTGPAGLTVNTTAIAGPINSASSTPTFTSNPPIVFGMPVPQAFLVTNASPYCTPSHPCTVNGENDYSGLHGSGSANNTVVGGGLPTYQGLGNVMLTFTVSAGGGSYGGTEVGGGGHLFFGGTASAGGVVSILYAYHAVAVPEPVSLFLVGGGLIGLAVVLRRKTHKV